MKIRDKFLLIGFVLSAAVACNGKEEIITPQFEYKGPVPAIVQGTTVAQKICYNLYKKFDLHVYYTLSGDEALMTGLGKLQTNGISNADALPMQKPDEAKAELFLNYLQKFYETLPEAMAKSTVLKRNVLVLVNPMPNKDGRQYFYLNAYMESQKGVVYFGDLEPATDATPLEWKLEIASSYFNAKSQTHLTGLPIPEEFGLVSKGLYSTENDNKNIIYDQNWDFVSNLQEILNGWGFVHYKGFSSGNSGYTSADVGSYAAWIVSVPLSERQDELNTYPRIKAKYDILMKYYKDNYGLDLEQMSTTWSAFVVNN